MICLFCLGGTLACRFRSAANRRLPVCLSLLRLIGHWSSIMTGHLDLICHRAMTALHVSQFAKRRGREIDGKTGGKTTVREETAWNWEMHFDCFNVHITRNLSHYQPWFSREMKSLALIQGPLKSLQWSVASSPQPPHPPRGNGCWSRLHVLAITTTTAIVFTIWRSDTIF